MSVSVSVHGQRGSFVAQDTIGKCAAKLTTP